MIQCDDFRQAFLQAREAISNHDMLRAVIIVTDEFRGPFDEIMKRSMSLISGYSEETVSMFPTLYGIPIIYREDEYAALGGIFCKYDVAVLFRNDHFLIIRKEDVMRGLYSITKPPKIYEQFTQVHPEGLIHSGKGIPNCIPESVA